MARNAVTYKQDKLEVNQDERIVFDWVYTKTPTSTMISKKKLCDYFYKRLHEVYTTVHMEKYPNAKEQ